MSLDPKLDIKNVLLGVTATKNDDATLADIIVMYWGGYEVLRHLFQVTDYDAIITIEEGQHFASVNSRTIQGVPLRYTGQYVVHVFAKDDETIVTAVKLLNKIRLSIITEIEANAQQATYSLKIRQDIPRTKRLAGFSPLWQQDHYIEHRPMVS